MTIQLTQEKSVELAPWKARNKKEFIKLFQNGKASDVTEEAVLDVLVYPNLVDAEDIFLSPDEIQYIMIKLKEISIGNEIKFSMTCDECEEPFDVDLTFDDMVHYREGDWNTEGEIITWRDVPKRSTVKAIQDKFPDEKYSDLEFLLHVAKVNGVQPSSLAELMETYDDFPLKDTLKIADEYNSLKSELELYANTKCPHCSHEQEYSFDVIPGFFDELMPK